MPLDSAAYEEARARQLAAVSKGDQQVLRPLHFWRTRAGLAISFGVGAYTEAAAGQQVYAASPWPAAKRARVSSLLPLGTPAHFSRSLGVSYLLLTADGQVVLTIRSSRNAFDVGRLAPLAENALVSHFPPDARRLDLREVVLAGLRDELGLPRDDVLDRSGAVAVTFTSALTTIPTGGPALLGIARTTLTGDQVLARHATAKDGAEILPVLFPWTAANAAALLREPTALQPTNRVRLPPALEWACWGPTAMMDGIRADFGDQAARRAARAAGYVEGRPAPTPRPLTLRKQLPNVAVPLRTARS